MTQRRHRIEPLLVVLTELIEKLDQLHEYRGRSVSGVATGFQDLDRLTGGLQGSDLVVLAGVASAGKTSFALSLALNTALHYGTSLAFFSPEMTKEQLVLRLLSMDAGVDQQRLCTGYIDDEEWERISESVGRLSGLSIFVPELASMKFGSLREQAQQYMEKRDFDLLILDSLQLMQGSRSYIDQTRRQDMDEISRGLKNLARELDVPVLVTYRLPNLVARRIDMRPHLRDLSVGAALEGDADLLLLVYREEQYDPETVRKNIGEFNVAKHRKGPTGKFSLYHCPNTGRFRDLEPYKPDY